MRLSLILTAIGYTLLPWLLGQYLVAAWLAEQVARYGR